MSYPTVRDAQNAGPREGPTGIRGDRLDAGGLRRARGAKGDRLAVPLVCAKPPQAAANYSP